MKRGFTLVEVVLALSLFGFVGRAAGSLLGPAAGAVGGAEARERLLWIASSVLDSLRSREGWSGGEWTGPGGDRLLWVPGETGGWLSLWVSGAEARWLEVPVGSPGPGPEGG